MVAVGNQHIDLSGFTTFLPTPFDTNGSIDGAAFEQHCRRQVDCGACGLVVGGLTGEAPTLTPVEHRILIHLAVASTRGRVPIIASAGSNATSHAIELTRDAERLGADVILSVVPYYNKPSQAGMIAHFEAIARSTQLPIILHDNPARCAVGLSDATLAHLAQRDQFIGLLDSTGDVTRAARLRAMTRPGFQLLSGHDATALAYLSLGGNGCISAASNILPRVFRALVVAIRHGDAAEAQALAAPILKLASVLDQEPDPVIIKFILSLLHLMRSDVRLPLVCPSPALKASVIAALRQIGELIPDDLHPDANIGALDHAPKSVAKVANWR